MHYLNFALQRPTEVDIITSTVMVKKKWRFEEVRGSSEGSQLAKRRMSLSNLPLSAYEAHVPPSRLQCVHACHESWETSNVIQLQSPRHRTWSGRCVQEAQGR